MGLTPECEKYVGRSVLVEPIYGYGWTQQIETPTGAYPEVELPRPFHVRIDRLFDFAGEMRGGIATVQEEGHPLDGKRVAFSTRTLGTWDFASKIAHYNLHVGTVERVTDKGWILAVGEPALVGFGQIRDDAV